MIVKVFWECSAIKCADATRTRFDSEAFTLRHDHKPQQCFLSTEIKGCQRGATPQRVKIRPNPRLIAPADHWLHLRGS